MSAPAPHDDNFSEDEEIARKMAELAELQAQAKAKKRREAEERERREREAAAEEQRVVAAAAAKALEEFRQQREIDQARLFREREARVAESHRILEQESLAVEAAKKIPMSEVRGVLLEELKGLRLDMRRKGLVSEEQLERACDACIKDIIKDPLAKAAKACERDGKSNCGRCRFKRIACELNGVPLRVRGKKGALRAKSRKIVEDSDDSDGSGRRSLVDLGQLLKLLESVQRSIKRIEARQDVLYSELRKLRKAVMDQETAAVHSSEGLVATGAGASGSGSRAQEPSEASREVDKMVVDDAVAEEEMPEDAAEEPGEPEEPEVSDLTPVEQEAPKPKKKKSKGRGGARK